MFALKRVTEKKMKKRRLPELYEFPLQTRGRWLKKLDTLADVMKENPLNIFTTA